jgi:hypothetical protein
MGYAPFDSAHVERVDHVANAEHLIRVGTRLHEESPISKSSMGHPERISLPASTSAVTFRADCYLRRRLYSLQGAATNRYAKLSF